MANPKNTIGDRDYGRRTYASKKTYGEQRRLATDAHINRGRLQKHSEFKKPYLPDETYPEMEMFNFDPDNPKWPGLPPGEPPTTGPVDPGGPVLLPGGPGIPNPFQGCMFYSNLPVLFPGQFYVLRPYVSINDPITSVTVEGQARITWFASSPWIILWINETIDMSWRPLGAGKASNDPLFVQITATTQTGEKCYANGFIQPCDDEDPGPQYDYTRSGQSVAPGGTLNIYIEDPDGDVLKGVPPFYWSISGTGFSFVAPKGSGRSNQVLAAEGSCGSGTITIVDNCGKTTKGHVRSTAGQWNAVPYYCVPGAYGVSQDPLLWFTQGNARIRQSWSGIDGCCCACSCGNCEVHDFGGGEPCESMCDNLQAHGCFVCLNSNVQIGDSFPSHCACNSSGTCPGPDLKCDQGLTCFGVNQLNVEEWGCPA